MSICAARGPELRNIMWPTPGTETRYGRVSSIPEPERWGVVQVMHWKIDNGQCVGVGEGRPYRRGQDLQAGTTRWKTPAGVKKRMHGEVLLSTSVSGPRPRVGNHHTAAGGRRTANEPLPFRGRPRLR
jgi:hypothetical protein